MSAYGRPDEIGPAVREEARRQRRARQEAARLRATRQRFTAFVTVVSIITLVVALRTLLPGESGIAVSSRAEPQSDPSLFATSTIAEEPTDPVTPLFAAHRSLQLFLPVLEADLTELAFHQASGARALAMDCYIPNADMDAVTAAQGTGRTASDHASEVLDENGEPRIIEGEAIRMWRSNRRGAPDTAADIGAAPGSPVFAPVTGTVLEVKTYQLYDKYEDIEIHIQPDGWPEIDLVIIHVTDPTIRAGDRVVGGATRIASVRLLSDRVNHQLAEYSSCPGDHVHLQLNRVEEAGATLPPEES